MGRPYEEKPWHADALKMRTAGVSYAQIGDALQVKHSTVKAFLRRNADSPDRQLEILLQGKREAPIAPVTLPRDDNERLSKVLLAVEYRKARVTMKLLGQVEKVIDMTVNTMDEFELKKGAFAVEALGKLKTNSVTVNATQNNNTTNNTLALNDERRGAIRARLTELATASHP